MRSTSLLLACCLAISPNAARTAEPSSASPPSESVKTSGEWYGWQIMLTDLGVIGALLVGGVLTGNSSAFAFIPVIGGVAFYAGGPVVHAAHRNGSGAANSLWLRILVPIGGAALGVGIGALIDAGQRRSDCGEGCGKFVLSVAGFGAGMLGAMATDWVTAREPIRAEAPRAVAAKPAWSPTLVVTQHSAGAGIVLRF